MSSPSTYFKSIESKKWDYIVLQDHSKAPISGRNQMIEAAEVLVEINQKNKANTIFFMTWPPKEKLHQIGEISMVYNNLGKSLDSKVAPVGLAWDYITRNSTIDLYEFDGIHPNQVGTLLTACTIFSTITDVSFHREISLQTYQKRKWSICVILHGRFTHHHYLNITRKIDTVFSADTSRLPTPRFQIHTFLVC